MLRNLDDHLRECLSVCGANNMTRYDIGTGVIGLGEERGEICTRTCPACSISHSLKVSVYHIPCDLIPGQIRYCNSMGLLIEASLYISTAHLYLWSEAENDVFLVLMQL